MLLAWLLGSTEEGKSGLGIYSQSFQLVMKPVQLITLPVTNVMLPALSRAQSDPVAYQAIALNFYRMIAVTLLPAGVGLFVVGRDVMQVLAPDWKEAGWLVTALAPAIMVQGFVNITGSVLASAGKTKWLFVASLVLCLFLLQGYATGYWLGESLDGVENAPRGAFLGVAASYSLVMVLVVLVPYLSFTCSLVGIRFRDLVSLSWYPAVVSLGMGGVTWLLGDVLLVNCPPWLRLLLVVPAGVIFFALLARQDVRWLVGQLGGLRSSAERPEPDPSASQ